MNTKHIEDRAERKLAKREGRKKATPKAKRPDNVARGSNKKKARVITKSASRR